MSTMINRKKVAKAGLVAGLGALAAAPIIATAKAARDSSCYRNDYIISRSSDYYWRRWRLPQQNRLLQRRLLLQQRLRRLMKNIGGPTLFAEAAAWDYCPEHNDEFGKSDARPQAPGHINDPGRADAQAAQRENAVGA
jgi:hypothetical protein